MIAGACPAHAQSGPPGATVPPQGPEVQPQAPGPFSLVGDVGFYTGAGVGAQVVVGRVGARGTVGWNPILVTVQDPDTFMTESIHVFSTAQANVDIFALPFDGIRGVRIGIAGSYKYNTLLGHGLGVAFEAQVARSRHFGWHLTGGVAYYPDGGDRVAEQRELAQDSEFNFPFGAGLQSGASIGIVYYP